MLNLIRRPEVPRFRVGVPERESGFHVMPDESIQTFDAPLMPGFSMPRMLQPDPSARSLEFFSGHPYLRQEWSDGGLPLGAPSNAWPGMEPVAMGDRKCQGCGAGRASGQTGAFQVTGRILCRNCAVKKLGLENETSKEQTLGIAPFSLDPYR